MAAALLLDLLSSPTNKRSSYLLLTSFVCLLQLMIFLNPIEKAEAKLVAYYNMESTAIPKSGYCPVPPYLLSPTVTGSSTPVFDWQTSKSGFGQALHVKTSSNFGYIDAGTYTVASTSNAYTLSAWVYVFSSTSTSTGHFILSKYIYGGGSNYYYSWALSVQQENSNRVPILFRAGVSSTNALFVQSSGNYPKLTWLHVVGVFNDGGFMKLYVNGTLANNPVNLNGQNAYESSADVLVGGGNSQNFEIYLDEVRIYDHAMTASQVSNLFGIAATQRPPTVSLSPATSTVPIDEPTTLTSSITNPDGRSLSYSWDIAGGCTKATFEPSNQGFSNVTITNGQVFSTYNVELQVYDGVFCASSTAALTLDSSPPGYDPNASNYPTNGILNVPSGGTADINLVLKGEPLPTIRWQEYVDLTARRELNYRHGIWETREMLEMRVAALLQACNATINVTTNCAAWVDIANATSARYTTPMGDSNLNHTLLRFSLTNSKGSFISTPVEIVVGVSVSSSSSSSGGDGGSDVGVIVGPIVGVVGACFCFCLLCLVLIVILLLLRRKIVTSGGFPGIPPDYEQIIFGTYLEPMFKIKSKNEAALQKLEKLLTSDKDFLLAFAAARGAKKNYEESLARSYVYLFYSHGQCDKALQAFIQQMIDGTADPSTMFRANTIDSKMFKYFSLLVAAQYLWEVLAEFVWEIQQDANPIDNPEGADGGSSGSSSSLSLSSSRSASRSKTSRLITGMEVDPTKMDEAADPKVNTLQLWLTAQKIFSAVTRSTSEMPKELADMLVFVHDITKETFSGEEYKAMGGFLFLRYVCPSLLAPHLYGLLEAPPTPTAQRQLILVGKVLQNLSNNTLPGNKEDYMQRLNEFITNNQGDLIAFYDEILSASSLSVTGREVPAQVKRNALADIYNIMLASKEGVFKELGEYFASGESIYEELEAIFSAGPIPTDN